MAALLFLSAERENVGNLLGAGAAEAALSAIGEEETAAAMLASPEKRGGAEAIVKIDGTMARHGVVEGVLHGGAGAAVPALEIPTVTQMLAVSGVEWAIWELNKTSNEHLNKN
jgi:hypothetical protein